MKISFVVPTRNSGRTIGTCLASLGSQTHDDVEVVVVDNASSDETTQIARAHADLVAQQGPERSTQRNYGMRHSTGDVVVFIDSDMVLEPGVAAAIAHRLTHDPEIGALIIPERSFGSGFFASCRVFEKSLYLGDPKVEAPRAFRRPVIEGLGGWCEALIAAEDWDLADRAAAAGIGVARVDSWIWHDEGRLRLRTTFTKKRYYGRWIEEYLRIHPEGRQRFARTALVRHPTRLLRHPVLTTGLVVLKITEVLGLYLGIRDARRPVPKRGPLPKGRPVQKNHHPAQKGRARGERPAR